MIGSIRPANDGLADMYSAELVFRLVGDDTDQAVEAVSSLLGAWYKNGQITTDLWPMSFVDGVIRVVALIPDPTALDLSFANRYVTEDLRALASHGVCEPAVTVSGPDPARLPTCECGDRASLVLYTNFLTYESPIRCGNCFNPVPLYRIPTGPQDEHYRLIAWQSDYRACDQLQINCTVGERFAERQLLRHDSALSELGRSLCREIADRAGMPTYYFLFKARGQTSATELRRRCPNCENEWLLAEPWHGLFEFKCDRCRLLSNVACSLR